MGRGHGAWNLEVEGREVVTALQSAGSNYLASGGGKRSAWQKGQSREQCR
jgi:hypothetical protein